MFVVILRKLCLVRKSEETTVWVWRLLLEVSEHWELMTPCRMWRELLNSIQKVSLSSAVTAWHGYWSNTYNLKMVLYKLRIFTHRVIMTEIMGQISVVDLVISFKRVLIFWSACGLQISPMLIGTELLRNRINAGNRHLASRRCCASSSKTHTSVCPMSAHWTRYA